MKRILLITVAVLLVALCSAPVFAGDSRFVISWKIVEDKRTGLIWTRAADFGPLDWVEASDLVKKLNEKEYAGFKDWRLPSREDLETLVTYAIRVGYTGGVDARTPFQLFNLIGFKDVQPYWYWSSSSHEGKTSHAWVVSMYNGTVRGENKDRNAGVWPVRGGK